MSSLPYNTWRSSTFCVPCSWQSRLYWKKFLKMWGRFPLTHWYINIPTTYSFISVTVNISFAYLLNISSGFDQNCNFVFFGKCFSIVPFHLVFVVAPKIKLIPFHCSHFVRPCRLAAQLSYSFHPNSLSHNIPDVETLIISPTHYTYSSSHCFKSVCCLPLRPCIKFYFFPISKSISTVRPCCTCYPIISSPSKGALIMWTLLGVCRSFLSPDSLAKGIFFFRGPYPRVCF